MQCNICLEEVKDIVFTPCIHGFCSSCLNTWLANNKTKSKIPCPICKYDISELVNRQPAEQNNFIDPRVRSYHSINRLFTKDVLDSKINIIDIPTHAEKLQIIQSTIPNNARSNVSRFAVLHSLDNYDDQDDRIMSALLSRLSTD